MYALYFGSTLRWTYLSNLMKSKDFWRETKCVICNQPKIHIQYFIMDLLLKEFLRATAHTLTATYDPGREKIMVHVSEVQTDESEI